MIGAVEAGAGTLARSWLKTRRCGQISVRDRSSHRWRTFAWRRLSPGRRPWQSIRTMRLKWRRMPAAKLHGWRTNSNNYGCGSTATRLMPPAASGRLTLHWRRRVAINHITSSMCHRASVIHIIADASRKPHATETPNIQASRVKVRCSPATLAPRNCCAIGALPRAWLLARSRVRHSVSLHGFKTAIVVPAPACRWPPAVQRAVSRAR